METNNKMSHGKLAGIFFIVLAVFQLIDVFSFIGYGFTAYFVFMLLLLAGFGVTGFALFTERRDKILLIGLSLIAAYSVLIFLAGFAWGRYDAHEWSYYSGGTYSFNLFYMLPALIQTITVVAALFAFMVVLIENFKQYEGLVRKFWFVPVVGMAAAYVVSILLWILEGLGLLDWWVASAAYLGFGTLVYSILMSVGYYFMLSWLGLAGKVPAVAIPNKSEGNTSAGNASAGGASYMGPEEEGYCSVMKHVLLLLFTFGIWYYIWIYKTTRYLNRVEGEEPRNPTTKLLLCMFVPFYMIYWIYKSAQRIDKLGAQRGVPSDLTTLCLILAIFVGIIPPILMQDKMNAIVMAQGNTPVQPVQPVYQQPVYQQPVQPAEPAVSAEPEVPAEPAVSANHVNDIEMLKKYKELLDAGILTQEEFDAKKKEILGL